MKKMKGVFAFKVKGAGGKEGVWVVDVKNGNGSVKFGSDGEEAAVSRNTLTFLLVLCMSLSSSFFL